SVEILADQTREVTATVSLVRGEEVLAESSRAVFVHGRHVFSWERPERLAAFVDPDDPALQSFVQSVWECRPETGKHEFPPPNVVSALTLLTGLADAGLHYLPDSTDFARPGSSFLSAWAAAWPRCTSATTDALKIVETEEAWRKYQPMNPPPDEATRDRIASTRWTGGETAGHVRAGLQSFQKLFEAN